MIENIVIPDIGEGVESGLVVAVHIQPGDRVGVNDTVMELETDKAVVEIPSTVEGKVEKVLVGEGDEVKVGDTIAAIETDGTNGEDGADSAQEDEKAASAAQPKKMDAGRQEEKPAVHKEEEARASDAGQAEKAASGTNDRALRSATSRRPPAADEKNNRTDRSKPAKPGKGDPSDQPVAATPSVRRVARELGVNIRQVNGSGPGGRITEGDVKGFVKERLRKPTTDRRAQPPDEEPALPDFSRWGDIEAQPLETVRRITAESTSTSWRTVPHVTQFDEADITQLETFLSSNAKDVADAGGKLTLTAVLAKVCAAALKKYPRFNASLDLRAQRILFKKFVHISIAVDTPRGLLMPVIRDADTKSITALAVDIVDLARRCRNKKIKPDELEGGTFSISNQGSIGGVGFTPIVLWPQAAILGVSKAATVPRLVEDRFETRRILPLSLSYDHRIIDGADAARFLGWICECLQSPFTLVLD